LAGELLREGEKLIHSKMHPQTIISGWRMARDEAKRRLAEIAIDNSEDH
jgi:T-complex protein 1 subunit beta